VCCVSFERGVILCDVCYLFVVSYCKPLPPGKNPFAVNKYYITLHYKTAKYLNQDSRCPDRDSNRASLNMSEELKLESTDTDTEATCSNPFTDICFRGLSFT
jgi:hypothetical protein